MRTEPAELSSEVLVAALAHHWQVEGRAVEYRPVGFGSHHWEVITADGRWFLTVDDLDAKLRARADTRLAAERRLRSALTTARKLADAGLRFVIAPLPAASGDVLIDLDGRFAAALYSPPALQELQRPWTTGPYAEQARQLLDRHASPLLRLLERYTRIAADVLEQRDRFVLTHGEPHPGNTLVTDHGLVLIDWDTLLLAPPERDLWTVAGDDRRVLDRYTAATGTAIVDLALTCYGVLWDLNEIAGYVALLRREHTDTADIAESWHNLQHFLQPASRWPQLC